MSRPPAEGGIELEGKALAVETAVNGCCGTPIPKIREQKRMDRGGKENRNYDEVQNKGRV